MTKIPYTLNEFAKELEDVVHKIQMRTDAAQTASVRSVMEELKPLVQKLLQTS